MNRKSFLILLALFAGASAHVAAQQAPPEKASLKIRGVLHDPLHPLTKLLVAAPEGNAVLDLPVEGLGEPQAVVASAKIPAGVKSMIALIVAVPGETASYKMMLIDDSASAFPGGQSQVVNLVGTEFAVEAGEHKMVLPSGKITRIPAVKKVNEFNQSQTNFHYRKGEKWEPFSERQMQYLPSMRRIFLIYSTPGAAQPELRTIVDYVTAGTGGN